MSTMWSIRRVTVALLLLVAFLCQETWALAGTTGGIGGTVNDDKGAPVVGAAITVVSPSQSASQSTDAAGHFSFLNLSPDTYTVSIVKSGYKPASYTGVSVFADQQLTLSFKLEPALSVIATTTSRGIGSLVKSGGVVDVYGINSATAAQMQMSGGGNNLNSSYSAIYSVPGVNSLPGNYGFGQVFYIHGSSYNQIGYEFDGVPVNRAFDNYNASSLSNLGVSSTEVYTGGAPAAGTAPTLGGYINQTIKTGTVPGYGAFSGEVGAPGFYHLLGAEAGGATPDRLFSYYVALRGANMIPNQINSQNGGNLAFDGNNAYGLQGTSNNTLLIPFEDFFGTSARGPWSDCNANGTSPANGSYLSPGLAALYGVAGNLPTCNAYGPILGALTTNLRGNDLASRDTVMNFHFGIPHHRDGGKDDVQLLYNNFFYQQLSWDNIATNGGLGFMENTFAAAGTPSGLGNYNTFAENFAGPGNILGPSQNPNTPGLCAYFNLLNVFGAAEANPCAAAGRSSAPYTDAYIVHNATFGQSAVGATNIVEPYLFPSTAQNRAFATGFSPYQVSSTNNNGSIVKLQYTKNIGANAYLRAYGYTFFSNWLTNDPNAGPTPFLVGAATPPDYELDTHTFGGDLTYANQLNDRNLVTADVSYVTANYLRENNSQYTFQPNGTPIATLTGKGGTCYSAQPNSSMAGLIDPGYLPTLAAGSPVSCLSALAGATIGQVVGKTLPAVPAAAAAAGATWQLTQNLQPFANVNTVGPRFLTASLQDELRPSDRWDINLGLRYESYGYKLGDVGNSEQAFWFNEINQTACVDPKGLEQVPAANIYNGGAPRAGNVPNGYPSYYTTAPGQPCLPNPLNGDPLFHPGQGGTPAISLGGTGTITRETMSPRVGFTYTLDPDSVIRFSYGRYTQPTQTASEQVLTYLDGFQMANNLYNSSYYNNGFASVAHDNPIQFSNNVDASYEQRLKGTDLSFKVSPFYRHTSNQSVEVSLPGGLSGSFNSGTLEAKGVELAVQKGDASRDGFSGLLSYTYTDSQLKYSLINGSNTIAAMLNSLKPFTSLEKINGGAPCYNGATAVSAAACATDAASGAPKYVANPYYNLNISQNALASQYPLTGFYPAYANFFPFGLLAGDAATAISPNIFAGFVSYKHGKWQATLNGNLWEGTQYGAPTNIAGVDPRSCSGNQSGIVPGSQLANYQTCGSSIAVPNPITGQFDSIAQYRNPWEFNLGGQIGYAVSPKLQATIALANVYTHCFGGSSEPWTSAYPPSSVVCAYDPNTTYLGWAPGEKYNTAGAGYYYGNSPHAAVNGSTGYPKVFDQAYAPGQFQISTPFQAYFQLSVRM